ncbi:BlaI/MecI/CopY family transcriptional regulator [Ascidiimonas meishanensis]|uniref:BlaI/MecI/CopY family transcriptional regulator n=1 Tax=Ascidiimonas meishanensis TaxID=3128903 RepID=UPI0039B748E0
MSKIQLSRAEEELMGHLWKLKKGFMKDILQLYKEPKPATTTLATLLKRMQQKEYVDYEVEGRVRRYYPLVTKKEYFSKHFKNVIRNFFNNDTNQFASFFTNEVAFTKEELEELQTSITDRLNKE